MFSVCCIASSAARPLRASPRGARASDQDLRPLLGYMTALVGPATVGLCACLTFTKVACFPACDCSFLRQSTGFYENAKSQKNAVTGTYSHRPVALLFHSSSGSTCGGSPVGARARRLVHGGGGTGGGAHVRIVKCFGRQLLHGALPRRRADVERRTLRPRRSQATLVKVRRAQQSPTVAGPTSAVM